MTKNLPSNAGAPGDRGLNPGSGRSPGGGNGNPLQYSCLRNPMDRGAWWATVHRVTESDTAEYRLYPPKIFSIAILVIGRTNVETPILWPPDAKN